MQYRVIRLAVVVCGLGLLAGCMVPVSYSYAKNPNVISAWHGTVLSVHKSGIYNPTAAEWVGTLGGPAAKAVRVKVILDNGLHENILQAPNPSYTLHKNEPILYVLDAGRVWVQPANYPLAPNIPVH
jgi:hypothetical protein